MAVTKLGVVYTPREVCGPMVELALRNFSPARLTAIIDQLATAALDMRKQTALAQVIAQRALLAIAVNARRKG